MILRGGYEKIHYPFHGLKGDEIATESGPVVLAENLTFQYESDLESYIKAHASYAKKESQITH